MQSEFTRRAAWTLLGCIFATLLTSCGTVQHSAEFEHGYIPPSKAMIKLGGVSNETGRVYDVDIEAMLAEVMTEALKKEGLLANGGDTSDLTLNVEIIEYAKGDAFKRWMWAGYGVTILEIHCDLLDGDQVIGVADARRTVDSGGGYTVGAWKYIYGQVAEDVVQDISAQLGH